MTDRKTHEQYAKYVSEFLGTYLLVFTIGCNCVLGSPVWGVLSIAAVLTVMIYSSADVSGANFNPAVSLALGIAGQLSLHDVVFYCVIQVLAGIFGAVSFVMLHGQHIYFAPMRGFHWWQAGLAEVIYTFMLCFVVLNTGAVLKPKGRQFYGLAIGFVIVAGGYGGGAISGGCFNPAVALGIDAVYYQGIAWSLTYVGFQFLGAAFAGVFFRFIRPEVFGRHVGKFRIFGVPCTCLYAEFVGTYILVVTVGLNVLGNSPAGALSIAAALMSMIYALGDVSGAHFNPAVTLAIVLSRRHVCSPKRGLTYVVAQTLAAMCAAGTYVVMHSGKNFPLGLPAHSNWLSAAFVEVFFTFVLCFVVLSTATVANGLSQYFGLAIGACILVGAYAVGTVSGGTMNPAASIGISFAGLFVDGGSPFWYCIIFAFLETLGGALAALLFYFTHPAEHRALIC